MSDATTNGDWSSLRKVLDEMAELRRLGILRRPTYNLASPHGSGWRYHDGGTDGHA